MHYERVGTKISSSGTDVDVSKFLTVEKIKFYKLSLGTASNTAEAVFAIASVSHEKRQSFPGKMLSKNDEGKDAVLDYNRDIPGISEPALMVADEVISFVGIGNISVPLKLLLKPVCLKKLLSYYTRYILFFIL